MLISAGGTSPPSSATVAELGKCWLADLERRGKGPNTVRGYRSKHGPPPPGASSGLVRLLELPEPPT